MLFYNKYLFQNGEKKNQQREGTRAPNNTLASSSSLANQNSACSAPSNKNLACTSSTNQNLASSYRTANQGAAAGSTTSLARSISSASTAVKRTSTPDLQRRSSLRGGSGTFVRRAEGKDPNLSPIREKLVQFRRSITEPLLQYFHDLHMVSSKKKYPK